MFNLVRSLPLEYAHEIYMFDDEKDVTLNVSPIAKPTTSLTLQQRISESRLDVRSYARW